MNAETSNLGMGASMWLRNNAIKLQGLPEPNQEWERRDVNEHIQDVIVALSRNGIIKKQRSAYEFGRGYYYIWSTNPQAYKMLTEQWQQDQDGFLPCGHHGFTNLGDVIKCKRDTCGMEFSKERVREHND